MNSEHAATLMRRGEIRRIVQGAKALYLSATSSYK
jgi:hypothetical protein